MRQHNGGGRRGSAGGRCQRFGGRGSGGNSRGNNSSSGQPVAEGNCAELSHAICTYGDDKQSERHTKTKDKILNCILAKFEHGKCAKESLEKLQASDMEQWRPEEIDDGTELGEAEKMTLQQEVRDHVQGGNKFEDNMCKAFGLILGQCTARLVNPPQNKKNWKTIEAKGDPIEHLSAIKEITQNFQDSKHPIATVYKTITDFFLVKQGEKKGLRTHAKRFKCAKDMLEQQHGKMALTGHIKRMKGHSTMTQKKRSAVRLPATSW